MDQGDLLVAFCIVLIALIILSLVSKAVNAVINLHGLFIILALVCSHYLQVYIDRKDMPQPRVSGYFHPAFRSVAEKFRENVESGYEGGASFSVYQDGEVLVDLWGGWADLEAQRHWEKDTLCLSWSVTKGVTALAIGKLVDSGHLDYKKEVYHYWPEFGTAEKRNVTVEMLLSHQAGLLALDEQVLYHDYKHNWAKVDKILASQKPHWPAGTAVGYHAQTWGMYADALVRRVDPLHRNVTEFFRQEVAEPLGIDYHIGLPPHMYHRFARFTEYSLIWDRRFNMGELFPLFGNQFYTGATQAVDIGEKLDRLKNPENLEVGQPSLAGVGTARGLAKLYDYLAHDGQVKGKRLISKSTADTLGVPLTKGLPGLFITSGPFSQGPFVVVNKQGHQEIGHRGYGGSYAYADMTLGVGVTYLTNHLSGYMRDPRPQSLMDEFYSSYPAYLNSKQKEGNQGKL